MTTSAEVPPYHCALDGRPFLLDLSDGGIRRQSVPFLKAQQDTSGSTGPQSLNPEGDWRRVTDDWSRGAGQSSADRAESDPSRFRTSKGIYVWDRWHLSLLPATGLRRASANTNLHLASAGDYLYLTDGSDLAYTTDSHIATPTWTTVSGLVASAASIATDGYNVWVAQGAAGIFATTRGAGTVTSYATGTVSLVGYANGRLMAASGRSLYNVVAAGALPAALYTHPNTDWSWTAFAEGPAHIFAAGFVGDKSLIYSTQIRADGTGLDVPVVACPLADGETVRSMQGYLGFLIVGTSLGVRLAAIDGAGKLTLGALIETDEPVLCMEPQGSGVWFGWSFYDDSGGGLGRLDLRYFTAPLTPAYATDLMAPDTGDVTSVVTSRNRRVFAVAGSGVWGEETAKVATGSLESGEFTFGIPDLKVLNDISVTHEPLMGSFSVYGSTNSSAFLSLGSSSIVNAPTTPPFTSAGFKVQAVRGEVRLTLTRAGSEDTVGPVLTSVRLSAFPTPRRTGEHILVPLRLAEELDVDGAKVSRNPKADFDAVVALETAGTICTFQYAGTEYEVLVSDHTFASTQLTHDSSYFVGTLRVDLKVVG